MLLQMVTIVLDAGKKHWHGLSNSGPGPCRRPSGTARRYRRRRIFFRFLSPPVNDGEYAHCLFHLILVCHSVLPVIPDLLPHGPEAVVRHGQEKWADLLHVRFAVLEIFFFAVDVHDLGDEQRVRRQINGLHELALDIERQSVMSGAALSSP